MIDNNNNNNNSLHDHHQHYHHQPIKLLFFVLFSKLLLFPSCIECDNNNLLIVHGDDIFDICDNSTLNMNNAVCPYDKIWHAQQFEVNFRIPDKFRDDSEQLDVAHYSYCLEKCLRQPFCLSVTTSTIIVNAGEKLSRCVLFKGNHFKKNKGDDSTIVFYLTCCHFTEGVRLNIASVRRKLSSYLPEKHCNNYEFHNRNEFTCKSKIWKVTNQKRSVVDGSGKAIKAIMRKAISHCLKECLKDINCTLVTVHVTRYNKCFLHYGILNSTDEKGEKSGWISYTLVCCKLKLKKYVVPTMITTTESPLASVGYFWIIICIGIGIFACLAFVCMYFKRKSDYIDSEDEKMIMAMTISKNPTISDVYHDDDSSEVDRAMNLERNIKSLE